MWKNPALCEQMRRVLQRQESGYLRMKRGNLSTDHFKKIKKIGVGCFGEVFLVRSTTDAGLRNGSLYAMKIYNKSHVIKIKHQTVANIIAERDVLFEANNEWIVKLYCTFQV